MRRSSGLLKAACVAASLLVMPCLAQAYDSGSTGVDGAFNPTASTVLQIPESGVFNFTTVNIPTGVTINFAKNSRNTPVTILSQGDVIVAGAIKVDGAPGTNLMPGTGGPGGFSGGMGAAPTKPGLRGEGPGGGGGGGMGAAVGSAGGGGAGFGMDGLTGNTYSGSGGIKGTAYGNEQILPLIGGSGGGGGGGGYSYGGSGGGGGGGAILIAASGTITVSGTITAKGGNGGSLESSYGGGGAGSGGSIRLIANILAGNGTISAISGYGGSVSSGSGGAGAVGRIRWEFNSKTRTATSTPQYTQGTPVSAVPLTAPTLTIQSIGGVTVPTTSQGDMSTPDITFPYGTSNPVSVVVKGSNIPVGTTVTINASPSVGTTATASDVLVGTDADSSVSIPVTIGNAYPTLITATCTYTVTVIAANGSPLYAEGERVEKVRIAAVVGGGSSVTYITASGREIPAVM